MPEDELASIEFASPDAEVVQKLDEYEQTRSPLALQQAADVAALHDGEPVDDPDLALQLARQRVAGWLAILEVAAQDLDPDFDPSQPPLLRVSPPRTASGAELPPGISPDALKDPEAKQAYLHAIEENAARIADFGRAAKLFQAQSVVAERAGPSIADAHTTLGMPLDEIRALVADAAIQPRFRDALLASLPA